LVQLMAAAPAPLTTSFTLLMSLPRTPGVLSPAAEIDGSAVLVVVHDRDI
jgi:hypothetical protein